MDSCTIDILFQVGGRRPGGRVGCRRQSLWSVSAELSPAYNKRQGCVACRQRRPCGAPAIPLLRHVRPRPAPPLHHAACRPCAGTSCWSPSPPTAAAKTATTRMRACRQLGRVHMSALRSCSVEEGLEAVGLANEAGRAQRRRATQAVRHACIESPLPQQAPVARLKSRPLPVQPVQGALAAAGAGDALRQHCGGGSKDSLLQSCTHAPSAAAANRAHARQVCTAPGPRVSAPCRTALQPACKPTIMRPACAMPSLPSSPAGHRSSALHEVLRHRDAALPAAQLLGWVAGWAGGLVGRQASGDQLRRWAQGVQRRAGDGSRGACKPPDPACFLPVLPASSRPRSPPPSKLPSRLPPLPQAGRCPSASGQPRASPISGWVRWMLPA